MAKLDLNNESRHLYLPSATERSPVDVPELGFAMIDGSGDPRRCAPDKLKTILRQPVTR